MAPSGRIRVLVCVCVLVKSATATAPPAGAPRDVQESFLYPLKPKSHAMGRFAAPHTRWLLVGCAARTLRS